MTGFILTAIAYVMMVNSIAITIIAEKVLFTSQPELPALQQGANAFVLSCQVVFGILAAELALAGLVLCIVGLAKKRHKGFNIAGIAMAALLVLAMSMAFAG